MPATWRAPAGISGSHAKRSTSGTSAITSTVRSGWPTGPALRIIRREPRLQRSWANRVSGQPYHFGPGKIADYLKRFHDLSIATATVHRILGKHGMNRLPAN